jgi:transposase
MVTAMWWVLRTGAAWRDVPREFGPWSSVYTRWRRWSRAGLWRRVVRRLRRLAVGRLWLADGSHIKVHQHGANPTGGQAAQAIGRTKGGLNSKLTVLADTHGRIVDFTLAAGPRNEQYTVLPLLPAARGRWLVADRGFDSNVFRQRLQQHRIRPCIPPLPTRKHALPYHRGFYRHRRKVENAFCRLKRFRRLATRYEKLALSFDSLLCFAIALDWLTYEV